MQIISVSPKGNERHSEFERRIQEYTDLSDETQYGNNENLDCS